ncbi:hypothetical protein [Candidatus Nitrotoga arctica]|uniref:Uncharacterized protein n=1 Tax=Candidatus Nitrotoga arctica TaxID=453162 RepID=A0ABM8YXF3_9PROT|nr:hypothetical protein [Candidatus Nitrotoga arctica]CAG9932216.1 conserved protein of unknown function [Candidatus Nitrotoga arctica]
MTSDCVDITGMNGDIAQVLLWPYMVHPDDENKRERLGAFLLAKMAIDTEYEICKDTLRRLVEAAEIGVGQDIENAVAGGCMAGDVLLILLEMAASNVKDGGLDKACHVVSTMYDTPKKGVAKGFKDGRGKDYKAGRDTVRSNWMKYRAVAHLWASHLIQLRDAEENGIRNDLSKWLDDRELASLAHSLQNRASQLKPPRNSLPILSDASLKIMGAPLVPLRPPALSEHTLEALKNFTPRIRE